MPLNIEIDLAEKAQKLRHHKSPWLLAIVSQRMLDGVILALLHGQQLFVDRVADNNSLEIGLKLLPDAKDAAICLLLHR